MCIIQKKPYLSSKTNLFVLQTRLVWRANKASFYLYCFMPVPQLRNGLICKVLRHGSYYFVHFRQTQAYRDASVVQVLCEGAAYSRLYLRYLFEQILIVRHEFHVGVVGDSWPYVLHSRCQTYHFVRHTVAHGIPAVFECALCEGVVLILVGDFGVFLFRRLFLAVESGKGYSYIREFQSRSC